MSVITHVEAKSLRGKIFRTLVILALVIGGGTMVFPFLLMVGGALRSDMDAADMGIVPEYLVNDQELVRKFLETKYNYRVSYMNQARLMQDYSFEQASVPMEFPGQRVRDLGNFVAETVIPPHWWTLGGIEYFRHLVPKNLYRLVDRLHQRYNNDLHALGVDMGIPLSRWRQFFFPSPDWADPRYDYHPAPYVEEYFALLEERPLAERYFVSLSGRFLENIVASKYGLDETDEYNAAHVRQIDSFENFSLPRRVPGTDEPTLREEWILFVHEALNANFVRFEGPVSEYRQFLQKKYGDVNLLAERWKEQELTSFEKVSLPDEKVWMFGNQQQDFHEFIVGLPPERLYLVGPEYAWQDWLKTKWGDVASLNVAHGKGYDFFADAKIPMAELETQYALENAGNLRWRYATRNFKNVFDEILFQGRPLINTLIYVASCIVLALILMPLAAYALSRFSPPGTWRFILIFMATMAFPPMVGMIPQFLILRKLSLLNTFVALVLPIIVNGYLIFLLKGFFDSLPQHLYEAACIDGASETRMFLEITMALSKPILAVVTLQTFNLAWISFMYPLIVCPKPEMHVLAVWLHQFQENASTPLVFASILVTSIPTLLIFLFTQRTIMRGIAVPAEK